MRQSAALYRLQKVDHELDRRRARVQAITDLLAQDDALRQAEAAVASAETSLRPLQTRAADLNLELKSVAAQTAQLTDRLYGGAVSNPKELEDIQEKIAERKRRHAELENRLLDTMIAVEDLQATLADAAADLQQVRAARRAETAALEDELARLKPEIRHYKAEREAALEPVLPESLALYKQLRAAKGGTAVALLSGDYSCTVCRVEQTMNVVQQVKHDDLVRCSSCGRILVAW